MRRIFFAALATLGFALVTLPVMAADVGQIKTVKGAVHIERDGDKVPAVVGAAVRQSDTVVTGADGSVGITFADNSLLSTGPNSVLVIERFAYDTTTHAGAFNTRLNRGTLSVVSGKIAKQSPDAMTVKTPSAVLGARGTEFVVRAEEGTR